MSRHALDAFDDGSRIGSLGFDSEDETFSFDYDPQWVAAAESYPLSPHIPISAEAAASSTVRRFIENLLPEGRALDVVSTTHQVSKNNLYALIREIGRETSGALSFLPEGVHRAGERPSVREIGREELSRRIEERAEVPFMVWDGRVRMSIAGYQDKLAVFMDQDRLYLVEGALASTHILKPEPQRASLPMLVANEHFCMSLAKRLALPAAATYILRLPAPVLVIERFDRVREAERVRRLHIIDACQALNLPVSYKYERNFGSGRDVRSIRDGVSFARLFSVAEQSVQKARTHLLLVRWAIFNYLIGNCDAHGKNVSFFCKREGLWLAPLYDLVSVVQYEGLEHDLAMAYGDAFSLNDITPFEWAAFARQTGTARSLLAREMRRMGKAALEAAPSVAAEDGYVDAERAFVARISNFVQEQARRLMEMATPMTQVDSSLL